eukprot:4266156-Prorocentrum_lima.AAC.1
MTSSLVGSEMCIRDRMLEQHSDQKKVVMMVTYDEEPDVCVYGLNAVSYTHLTLPTICSV